MKTVLVAPLDWGLGHAASSVPLIRILLEKNCRVIIGGAGGARALLRQEFPNLEEVDLPEYGIRYNSTGSMALTIARQLPKLLRTARREHLLLPKLIAQLGIDVVISYTRFGLWTDSRPCVYITHQLRILTPSGLNLLSPLLSRFHQFAIDRYSELWIPDYAGNDNLSGRLSHNIKLPKNGHYIGPLSRFKRLPQVDKTWDGLILLSGPEPQRTILERIIEPQLSSINKTLLMVRGRPGFGDRNESRNNITIVDHLPADELNQAVTQAKVIISRPGYSTIMDLAAAGGKAVFIPTPGQTEQEYLAERFFRLKIALQMRQEEFDLSYAFQEYDNFRGFSPPRASEELLEKRINFLLRI